MSDAGLDEPDDGAPAVRPEVVAAVRERLRALEGVDDRAFVGPPIAGLPLRPLELGELVLELKQAVKSLGACGHFASALREASRVAGFETALAGEASVRAFAGVADGGLGRAVEFLGDVLGEPSPAVCAEIRRILGPSEDVAVQMSHSIASHRGASPGAIALARLAGPAWLDSAMIKARALHDDSPIRRAEVDVLPRLSLAALLAFDKSGDWYSPAFGQWREDPAAMLAGEPAYLDYARTALEIADERLRALHDGEVDYAADRLFNADEAQCLARAARVAARHDAPWFGPLIARVLPRVCVAPTAAKTLPSQSVAIALGYAMQTDPTPEGVEALRAALAVVRHAGIDKKLARNLKPAERGLAARPEVALRMLVGAKADKKRQGFVATCLEATWWMGGDWPLAQWRTELAETPNGAPFAFGQLWRVTSGGEPARVLRAESDKKAALRFVDVDGRGVELADDARLSLWHPMHSTPAEREAWQRVAGAQRLRPPVRQAFREIYAPSEGERAGDTTRAFEGLQLRLRPLVGLARREGWSLNDVDFGMTRRFGAVRAWFEVGAQLFPGREGNAPSGGVSFVEWRDGRWRPASLGTLPPAIFSEACRAVDLLVSASAHAVDDVAEFGPLTLGDLGVHLADTPAPPKPARAHPGVARMERLSVVGEQALGAMAAMRRRALALALAPHVDSGRVAIEARHVRVGDATVHLATGRVVENGAAVELEPLAAKATLAAVPWLPYDEVLLKRIVDNVAALLARP